jgi:hypothetical protein
MLALLNRYLSCHPTVAYRCLALTMKVPLQSASKLNSSASRRAPFANIYWTHACRAEFRWGSNRLAAVAGDCGAAAVLSVADFAAKLATWARYLPEAIAIDPLSDEVRDAWHDTALGRYVSHCRTSATTCRRSPVCSIRSWSTSRKPMRPARISCVKPVCYTTYPAPPPRFGRGLEPASCKDGRQVPYLVRRRQPGHGANTAQQLAGREPQDTLM